MDFNQIIKSCGSSPAKITKSDKDFAKGLDFKEIKFPVRIHKIKKKRKKNSISSSVFVYKNKKKRPTYVSKKSCEEKHVNLSLIGDEGKRHYVLIKDVNTFIYDRT